MRRALTKAHLRVAAVDDGAFHRTDPTAPLVTVVFSTPDALETVAVSRVTVDGTDATARIADLLAASGHLEGVRAILLDGGCVGGFNVVDLDVLARRVGRPVVAVTRRRPDLPAIRAALRKWFPHDHGERYRRLTAHRLFRVPTGGLPIWAAAAGCARTDAIALVARTTRVGFWPEPLRIAHLVGHALGAAPRSRPRSVSARDRPSRTRRSRPRRRPRSTRRS